jgi:hypothetical protein
LSSGWNKPGLVLGLPPHAFPVRLLNYAF